MIAEYFWLRWQERQCERFANCMSEFPVVNRQPSQTTRTMARSKVNTANGVSQSMLDPKYSSLWEQQWGHIDLDVIIGDDDDSCSQEKHVNKVSHNSMPVNSLNKLPKLVGDDREDLVSTKGRVKGSSTLRRVLHSSRDKHGRLDRLPGTKDDINPDNASNELTVSENTESTCSSIDEPVGLSQGWKSPVQAVRNSQSKRSKSPGSLKKMFRKVRPGLSKGIKDIPKI